ncbi:putative secreted protein [Operophtera brumata]|uniref:Putative secreted protein n=1 Tax=Operophtera brumata TaxID=104452 RepID=A0A0L7KYN1_OPEBR|nr:putative secreted protein [Operophtera brumata]
MRPLAVWGMYQAVFSTPPSSAWTSQLARLYSPHRHLTLRLALNNWFYLGWVVRNGTLRKIKMSIPINTYFVWYNRLGDLEG